MYPVNYLLSKLQNKFRNAFFEGQTNLFEVQDQSLGTILDTTTDAYFLSFFSGVIGDFNINSNNQISLTASQVQAYIGARMYYYNPKILDTVINSLYSTLTWFDVSENRTLLYTGGYSQVQLVLNKGVNSGPTNFMQLNSAIVPFTSRAKLINGYLWYPFISSHATAAFNQTSGVKLLSSGLNSSFTLAFAIYVSSYTNEGYVIANENTSPASHARVSTTLDASNLTVKVYLKDADALEQNITFTFDLDASGVYRVVLTSNGTTLYCYCNEQDVQSIALDTFAATTLSSQVVLNRLAYDSALYSYFLELLLTSTYSETSACETILSYLKTKYFVLT